MHEMRKSETVQQHPHRYVDGRKDVYGVHKLNDKDHHKSTGSSSSGRTERDHRSSKSAQIPGAIRVCGDWSEHLSSNGKVYFFNNKSKSSQWERPKEWSNSRAIEVKKDKLKALHNRVSSKHSNEGSSGGHHAASRPHKSGYPHAGDAKKLQQHMRHRTNHESQGGKDFRDRDYRTASNSSAKDRDYRDIDYRDSRSSDARASNSIESRSQHEDKDYRSSNLNQHENVSNIVRQLSDAGRLQGKDNNNKNSTLPNEMNSSQQFDTVSENKVVNDDPNMRQSKEERPKSSSSTPRSEGTKAEPKVKTLKEPDGETTSAANGSEETPTAALVQTLSTVLNQASNSTSDDGQDSSSLEGNLKNALQMLLTVAAQNQQIAGNEGNTEDTPQATEKEEPPAKRLRPTDPTDERVKNSLLVCQSAEKALENLKNLFDEKHTIHVQGWPADQMERQSVRLCDENHQFMVNHTSQLSASMKVARSQVRSAEIHSTLQEQRILYLRQQVKDLEKSTTVAPFT